MSKNFDYCVNLPEKIEILFKQGEYLGEGHNGVVFLLPDNMIIKFFRNKKVWKDESSILLKTKRSRFFPKIYYLGENYIVREYVEGIRLDKYLKKNELSEKLCKELYEMVEDFKKLKFTRQDLRCKDIFVQLDGSIKIIDPKNNYKKVVKYPRHLMKGLYKKECLEVFLNYVCEQDFKKYTYWKYKIESYLKYQVK
ncbi:hypothetical protein SAMN02745163_02994 [Clostridium cavendishii DSM 21758]|uniref:Serine/threonine protein kinase n=1 Tax=Clostridium cavendishii DSM 21758 TaxID=1121302 RepID=A0A1M6NRQ9_9CLOT|nr:hypothetical protein [Clostridium cavendishii]SHJ98427.1 hypothetical protein SAMN02745163_02994 [Clostridium cavendishii DSM 21758]